MTQPAGEKGESPLDEAARLEAIARHLAYAMAHYTSSWTERVSDMDLTTLEEDVGLVNQTTRTILSVIQNVRQLRERGVVDLSLAQTRAFKKGSGDRLTREDYGETILPVGTTFEVLVDSQVQLLQFAEKHVIVDGIRHPLSPHKLFLLSVFVNSPGVPLTKADILDAGYCPKDIGDYQRGINFSSTIGNFCSDMRRLFSRMYWIDVVETDRSSRQSTYTWILPATPVSLNQGEEEATTKTALRRAQPKTTKIDTPDVGDFVRQGTEQTEAPPRLGIKEETGLHDNDNGALLEADDEIPTAVPSTAPGKESSDTAAVEEHSPEIQIPPQSPEIIKQSLSMVYNFISKRFELGGDELELNPLEQEILSFLFVMKAGDGVEIDTLFKFIKPARKYLERCALLSAIDMINRPWRFAVSPVIVSSENEASKKVTYSLSTSLSRTLPTPSQMQALLQPFLAAQRRAH